MTLPVWAGTGLLVPMLLLAPVLGPAAMTRDKEAGVADVWAYEQIYVMVSLIGVGIGLPLALAGYAKARWPGGAMGDPIDCGERPGHTRQLRITLARLVAAGCILLGVIKVFWTAGGTLSIDPAMLNDRDVSWHLLSLSTGAWTFAGAWCPLVLTSRRESRRLLPPRAAARISSGMLFSYSLYNLVSAVRPDAESSREYPLAWALTMGAGIVLSVMMGMIIMLVLHDRQRALRGEPGESAMTAGPSYRP